MKLGKSGKIEEVTPICPNEDCKKVLDGFTGINHNERPSGGSLTVCIGCGWVLRFNDDLSLGVLTIPEYMALDEENQREIDTAQAAVYQMIEQRGKLN